MSIDWSLIFTALGLALVFEGLPYFLWSERMPEVLLRLAAMRPGSRRLLGLTSIVAGLVVIWLVRA